MLGTMPQKRSPENKGFPTGWRKLHGAIHYKVPKSVRHLWNNQQLFRLGKTPAEAYRTWADRVELSSTRKTLNQIFDRYLAEIVPQKAPATQGSNRAQIERLRPVFGHMYPDDVTPQDAYGYVDRKEAKVSAKRDMALLSHALTKAIRWGDIKTHPFKGQVRFDDVTERETPRDRYVEDWEIAEIFTLKPKRKKDFTLVAQAYTLIKNITGMSKGDLLRIQPSRDFKEDGIHIQRNKTKKKTKLKTVYEWSERLRVACDLAIAVRPVDISPFLFCKADGQGYVNEETGRYDGWNSNWHRIMSRMLKETKLEERFTDHDIRAKVSSDAETDEQARKLMSHANVSMTRRVYRRKPERVQTS